MRRALLKVLVSCGVTYVAGPIVRAALVRGGSMDIPNHRSSHTTPVPRGGGLACLAGVAAGTLVLDRNGILPPRIAGGVTGLALLGLADDQLGHIHHNIRLAGQALAGAAFAPSLVAVAPIAGGTVGVVNVVNFMDGINGITGITAGTWGLATLATGRVAQDLTLQTIGAVTAGAGLGFLPWNVPQPQLFLGDIGSYLFGGLMAAGIATASNRPKLALRVAAPLLPYGLDASQALIRRARARKPLTQAHRDHTYQQLVDHHELSHLQVSLFHAVTAAVIGAAWSRSRTPWTASAVSAAASIAYVSSPSWVPLARRMGKGEGL